LAAALTTTAIVVAQTRPATKKKASSSKSSSKSNSKSGSKSVSKPAHRRTSKSTSKSASKSTSKSTKKQAGPRRSAQQQPTPQRYKEIQQVLADKGYFKGQVDGNWGPSSIDALKRFQHDQSLAEDGKIGSLSLMALGLGPKRVAHAEPAPQPKPPQ